tara:strand:- start:438 stop:983 length:546 start_codon:yes stop_codon:yes gene_type:complete
MKFFTILYFLLFLLFTTINLSSANEGCLEKNKNKIKVEAWLSKKYEKKFLDIQKEFLEMGNTKVGLFIYPAENPSRVVAIGRCVPVYLAQYFLKKAKKYSLGTTHLVNQRLISENWFGMGTSMFGKNSMSPITSQQLTMLMDEALDNESFQKMYRSLTVQNKKINIYGLVLDNPRFLPSKP